MAGYGVARISSFGAGEPEDLYVAISEWLPKEAELSIITIAKELDFTHYVYFDNVMEETQEMVLFGSYGGPKYEII